MISTDIGIDLGTASILVYVRGKGVVLKEPSVVAFDRDTNKIKAIGEEARLMLGRTPGNIVAVRPLRQGVISDYAMAEANYAKIVPHNPLGPVSTAACLQLDAAIPNFGIQEFPSFYHNGNEAEMTKEPFCEDGGYILIPDKPGIGIELIDDITEKFPPKQRSIFRPDGL